MQENLLRIVKGTVYGMVPSIDTEVFNSSSLTSLVWEALLLMSTLHVLLAMKRVDLPAINKPSLRKMNREQTQVQVFK